MGISFPFFSPKFPLGKSASEFKDTVLRIIGFSTCKVEHDLWPGLLLPRSGSGQGITHAEEMRQPECLFTETLSYLKIITNLDDMENYNQNNKEAAKY